MIMEKAIYLEQTNYFAKLCSALCASMYEDDYDDSVYEDDDSYSDGYDDDSRYDDYKEHQDYSDADYKDASYMDSFPYSDN